MTLPVPRLLRRARCMYGRRGLGVRLAVVGTGNAADGQRSLALGPGSTVSSLVDARSSAGIYPTTRLLRWWWIDVDGTVAAEAFFGGISMKKMKI